MNFKTFPPKFKDSIDVYFDGDKLIGFIDVSKIQIEMNDDGSVITFKLKNQTEDNNKGYICNSQYVRNILNKLMEHFNTKSSNLIDEICNYKNIENFLVDCFESFDFGDILKDYKFEFTYEYYNHGKSLEILLDIYFINVKLEDEIYNSCPIYFMDINGHFSTNIKIKKFSKWWW